MSKQLPRIILFLVLTQASELAAQKPKTPLDYGYGTDDAATITFGSFVMIAKNLNVTQFANGDPIREAKYHSEWVKMALAKQPAWCDAMNVFERASPNGGKLYNWYAVNDPRGLAPAGWHIPSAEEWRTLAKSNMNWWDKAGSPWPSRFKDDTYGEYNTTMGAHSGWWSSTEDDDSTAVIEALISFPTSGFAEKGVQDKSDGLSVRCIKNSKAFPGQKFVVVKPKDPEPPPEIKPNPEYGITDYRGKQLEWRDGISMMHLGSLMITAGAGYKILNMRVTLASGTTQVRAAEGAEGRVNLHEFSYYSKRGDKLIIKINRVVRIMPDGRQQSVPVVDGLIKIELY